MRIRIIQIFVFAVIISQIFLSGCTTISDIQRSYGLASVSGPEFKPYESLKRVIAVLDFADDTELGKGKVGPAISDMIMSTLARSGRFILIERTELDRIFEEQGLGQSGVMTEETAVNIGKLLGAHALVMGRLEELYFQSGKRDFDVKKEENKGFSLSASVGVANVSFKVVDTSTGEILISDNFTSTDFRPGFGIRTKEWAFEDLEEFNQTVLGVATRKSANKIAVTIVENVDLLPWSGKVIKAEGGLVYFTPGRNAGIKVSQLFEIHSNRVDSEMPDSSIAKAEVIGFIGNRVTKAQVVTGSGVMPGDVVRECEEEIKSESL